MLILAGSVLLSVRLLASADDTVGVWAVRRDLPAGATLTADGLVRKQIQFGDSDVASRYLSADQEPPTGQALTSAVRADELLPRAALRSRTGARLVEVPISVALDDMPATVQPGSSVDVWVAPKTVGSGSAPKARKVLAEVVVVSLPPSGSSFAPFATRQVIVGVPAAREAQLDDALGAISAGRVVLTRRQG